MSLLPTLNFSQTTRKLISMWTCHLSEEVRGSLWCFGLRGRRDSCHRSAESKADGSPCCWATLPAWQSWGSTPRGQDPGAPGWKDGNFPLPACWCILCHVCQRPSQVPYGRNCGPAYIQQWSHSKIWSFEWVNDLIIREQSHRKWWSPPGRLIRSRNA